VLTEEEERGLDVALEEMGDVEAGVLLLITGLHGEAIQRFDRVVSSGSDIGSALRWRAQAFASIGMYQEACEDLIRAREGRED
jgi:hypothetical protein